MSPRSLSSWYTLTERNRVHNRMPVFSRGCVARIDVQWSQIWFRSTFTAEKLHSRPTQHISSIQNSAACTSTAECGSMRWLRSLRLWHKLRLVTPSYNSYVFLITAKIACWKKHLKWRLWTIWSYCQIYEYFPKWRYPNTYQPNVKKLRSVQTTRDKTFFCKWQVLCFSRSF